MADGETILLVLGVIATGTAAIIGLRKVGGHINAALRRQDRIDELLTRELGDDGNGSLKSQVRKTAGQVEALHGKLDMAKRELAFLQHTVDLHVADLSLHAHDPEAHRRPDTPDDGMAGPRGDDA
jgi:hypothetical protein